MKNILSLFCLSTVTVLLTGCPKPGPKHETVQLGTAFTLAHDQTKQTSDGDLTIHFDKVSGDSRCPEGVQCIWAGRVDCIFTLTKGGASQVVNLSSGDLG